MGHFYSTDQAIAMHWQCIAMAWSVEWKPRFRVNSSPPYQFYKKASKVAVWIRYELHENIPFLGDICETYLSDFFLDIVPGRQGLVGSSGGYTSHASLRACSSQLEAVRKCLETEETTKSLENNDFSRDFSVSSVSWHYWIRKLSSNRRNNKIPLKSLLFLGIWSFLLLDTFKFGKCLETGEIENNYFSRDFVVFLFLCNFE